jgi:hypothetical protein
MAKILIKSEFSDILIIEKQVNIRNVAFLSVQTSVL